MVFKVEVYFVNEKVFFVRGVICITLRRVLRIPMQNARK